MSKQEPMLMESGLTKRVYVVTSYVDNGDGTFTARRKHDVTEQFDALAKQRRGTCKNEWEKFGKFRCSVCWLQIDSMSTNTTQPMPVKFCPSCGAEVVRR